VFTLLPLITGENRAHHGKILAQAAALAEAGKLRPLINERRFRRRTLRLKTFLLNPAPWEKLSSKSKALHSAWHKTVVSYTLKYSFLI
jgi:hypothetical protein